MKKILIFLLIVLNGKTNCEAKDGFKDVKYSWNDNSITWASKTSVIPCEEPFHIIVSDLPKGITEVKVVIFNSIGRKLEDIAKGPEKKSEINAYKIENNFIGFVDQILDVGRWFYFEITISIASVNETRTIRAYATPLKNEISKLEFFGGIGLVGFTQEKLKKFEPNIGFATGMKIKFRPVSTNPNIGRFGLYPLGSRLSFVIATIVNDLYYNSTELKSPIIGIKPTIGFDIELTENLALSLSTVIVNQETKSKLTNKQNLAMGFFLSLSFSTEVFKSFKSNTPISPKY
jgi:hypothetical protein